MLQDREMRRVGGDRSIKVDVRVMAATNSDVAEEAAGAIPEDPDYRLHVVPIDLPPLRERPGDIPLLIHPLLRNSASSTRASRT